MSDETKEIMAFMQNMFDSMNKRFDRLEERIGGLEQEVGEIKVRLDSVERRLDSVEKRLDSLEKKQDILYDAMANTREDITRLNLRVDKIAEQVNNIEQNYVKDVEILKYDNEMNKRSIVKCLNDIEELKKAQ